MRLVTPEEMRRIEEWAIKALGLPGMVLMENAGLRAAEVAGRMLAGADGKTVLVFAGKGNNGGDGCVIARHLINRGAVVWVGLLAEPGEFRGDAAANLQVLEKMIERDRLFVVTAERLPEVERLAGGVHLIVDAIFGTGLSGAVRGLAASVIELLNASGRPVMAVDIPSGLNGGNGRVEGTAVRATATVTFGAVKIGLVLHPGAEYAGAVYLADIGMPDSWTGDPDQLDQALDNQALIGRAPATYLITDRLVRDLLPPRPDDSHKGAFGHVLVAGGSGGMSGSVAIAGQAALRSGAGLVTVGAPSGLQPVLAAKLTEEMTVGLPETPGHLLLPAAARSILEQAGRYTVIVVGPGMGTGDDPAGFLKELLEGLAPGGPGALVIDADGLNILAARGQEFKTAVQNLSDRLGGRVVLTPHPGEMARLMGLSTAEVQRDRLGMARCAAGDWRVTVILKGSRTVIADPGGRAYINLTGNAGMATAGMGDLLAGVVGGLLAQGLGPAAASLAAVFLHGAAGDLAAEEIGPAGIVAGDLLPRLPRVIAGLVKGNDEKRSE
ncbi:MAG: NAD(P)H-hydrate dehydratase [Firmicutes bacterium]|nr:NAD(P)H-hydrate dehydratase [Bacillota bacterium]